MFNIQEYSCKILKKIQSIILFVKYKDKIPNNYFKM